LRFNKIDSVAGRNTSAENIYAALDKTPLQGLNYYRLKQVDGDGKFSYSNVIAVKLSNANNKLSILPNPVKDVASISIIVEVDQSAALQVLDGFGRVMQRNSYQLQKGEQVKQLNLANLAPGTYYLTLHTSSGKLVSRFVKV